MTGGSVTQPELWAYLRTFTPARVGIRSINGALPTEALLELRLGHANARDAVLGAVDFEALAATLPAGLPVLRTHSLAANRNQYLRHPDLGRRLHPHSRELLAEHAAGGPFDLVFVIADGLSSAAVSDHAVATLRACLAMLPQGSLAPIVMAEQGRVALGDEIGWVLGARACVMLIGERPGLSVANSLGAYLTWAPLPGRSDAERNCISNIHQAGLGHDAAAAEICWLLERMRRQQRSGTAIKNERHAHVTIGHHPPTP